MYSNLTAAAWQTEYSPLVILGHLISSSHTRNSRALTGAHEDLCKTSTSLRFVVVLSPALLRK